MIKMSEEAQEILERLWLAEEADEGGLPVAEVLPRATIELAHAGLAAQENSILTLTQAGRLEAARAIRRHRLGERLLADVLRAEDEMLEQQACRLEHVLYDGLDESICTLLGHPHFCPHGKPIPPGECCRQMRATVGRLIAPLADLEPGQSGEVAYIQTNDPGRLQKLMAMGVLPGGKIVLLRRYPTCVFECGLSQFAVDEVIARDIFVRLSS